jgi:hypothetical protein
MPQKSASPLNRFGIFFLFGLFISYVNAFFMWSRQGEIFLVWWANHFAGFYQSLFPHMFALGPPRPLIQALALLFAAAFNTLALVTAMYAWESWRRD